MLGSSNELWYFSNRAGEPRQLAPGVYGLSNHLLDTPWPKLTRACTGMRQLLGNQPSSQQLLETVSDRRRLRMAGSNHGDLASERESMLSAQFITSEAYGTRASTALSIRRQTTDATLDEDVEAIERAVLEIGKRVGNMDDIQTLASTIKSNSEKILKRIDIDRDALQGKLAILKERTASLRGALLK